uniref:Phorbol-ester/DAG-type domain-containing protein n=1 Tax=Phytophthora ramorum TaxID=164328 RepID=H3HED8_PHYRM
MSAASRSACDRAGCFFFCFFAFGLAAVVDCPACTSASSLICESTFSCDAGDSRSSRSGFGLCLELRHNPIRIMELRFRGKKSAEDADTVAFWLCEGSKKRRVLGKKSLPLALAAAEWDLPHMLENEELHWMNESTGLVVPRDQELGKFVSDRDVVRLCSTQELGALLDKFATRDQEVAAEMMHPKALTPMSAALSRLKKISVTNPTLKKLQKTLDERTSPHSTTKVSEEDALDQSPELDPIFESGEIEEITENTGSHPKTCDMCEVSWPDDVTGSMYRWTKLGIITHQGCAQFTADVLAQHPEITTREEFLSISKITVSSLNKPGTFHVTVHRAMELPGTQLIGKQAPYAKLSLLPWKEPLQTKPVENGGRNPVWIDAHENLMQFSHMYNSTITPIPLLEVEVYNYNYLADDQVACTLVDMSPLLRYPNIAVKRWFTLSSRALLTQSTGQPKIMLEIKFVPTEGEISTTNAHKFRVHQLKSIGLVIPICAVCDRSIMNALKSIWGYRCELCGIDVHKACMMKATIQCECVAPEVLSTAQEEKEHGGINFRVLTDGAARPAGELFFDSIVHETSPVLKSADPMYMENLCFKLLQREADKLIRTNSMLISLREPLRHVSLNNETNQAAINDSWAAVPVLTDQDHYKLSSPLTSKSQPDEKLGYALIDLEYVERKEDLLRIRLDNDSSLLEREDKEFSVESLRVTIERFGRAVKIFQGIDAGYASIISWKNKKKSAVCFIVFVYGCLFADFEYTLSYIFGGVLLYMLYRLHIRLEGAFVARWIGYEEYELEQEEQQKLYRPLADLHVAVHEANLSDETDSLLRESQSRLKDVSSSKLGFYVRIKYRPNDNQTDPGDIVLNPSGYEETIVAWTNVVDDPSSQNTEKPEGDCLLVRVELRVPEGSNMSSNDKLLQHEKCETQEVRPAQLTTTRKKRPVRHVERSFSEFVCESMIEKEKSKIIGANLLDAFWKVKDTIRQLQTEIGLVRGRWAILVFGVTEFGAVFIDDAPTSKRVRKILWNYLSSLPTDQDLIELYNPERAVYMKNRKAQQQEDEQVAVCLRYHALWTGIISSKAEGDRNSKSYFMVCRPYRFLLWKSEDDAEEGSQPLLQLLFAKPQAIADKSDDKVFAFKTRVFTLDSLEKKDALLDIIRQSCRV